MEISVNDKYLTNFRSKNENYLVVDENKNIGGDQRCCIYFSSNALWYPNTIEAFIDQVENKDKYEWYKTRVKDISRHIYVRDVYKQWYLAGINEEINDPKALLDLLRQLTDGYIVTTIGSSAGGFASIYYGYHLKADKILAFAPQISLEECLKFPPHRNPIVFETSRSGLTEFLDLRETVDFENKNIFLIFPSLSQQDIMQCSLLEGKNANIIYVRAKEHGIPCFHFTLQELIGKDKIFFRSLCGKNWSRIFLAIKVLGFANFMKIVIWKCLKKVKDARNKKNRIY